MIIFPSHVFKLNYICRVLLCKVTCSKVPGIRVWTSWVEKSIFLLPTVSTINIPRRYVWVAACNRPFPFLENYPSIHSEMLLYLSYLHVLPYISQIHIFLKNLPHTHTHTHTHTHREFQSPSSLSPYRDGYYIQTAKLSFQKIGILKNKNAHQYLLRLEHKCDKKTRWKSLLGKIFAKKKVRSASLLTEENLKQM